MQQRYCFHKLLLQRALMRAVGAVCEIGNAVASLRENGDVVNVIGSQQNNARVCSLGQ